MSAYCHLGPADREALVQVLRETLPSPFEVIASAKRRSIIRDGAVARAGLGIYFLFNSGRLVYIGQSVQIARRLRTHSKEWRFDEVAIIETPQLAYPMHRAWMDVAEAFYIDLLDPSMNDRHIGHEAALSIAMPLIAEFRRKLRNVTVENPLSSASCNLTEFTNWEPL